MKFLRLPAALGLAATVFASFSLPLGAQAPAAPEAPEPGKTAGPELEAKLIATLTEATLKGRWTGIKDGQLTAEKDDTYQVVSAAKVAGDRWTISARMNYGGQSMVVPIPVQVQWAGDTAVLIIENLSVGRGATYSARVLIHEGTYAGTWRGGERGGLLSGLITNAAK